MSGPSTYVPKSRIGRWFESRLPLFGLVHSSFIAYPVPRNLNYMWTFGAILSFMLVAQIVTGVVLAMHYIPSSTQAFSSVDNIMRDVNYGWLIRYLHTNGASLFFFAGYIHMFRGLYYGSFKPPRELLWIIGVIIYFLMMATAFMGYVLPWGSMSSRGRDRHHQPHVGNPARRQHDRPLALGRIRRRRPDIDPILFPSLPAAVHHRGVCGAPCLGAPRHRAEQS